MKVGMISLGCDKNRVDTEKMLFRLQQAGFTLTNEAEEAEVMIINTCAFIESAKKEAIETVFETAKLKERNLKKLIVTGCFAQRYPDVEFPEVDRFASIADEERIAEIVAEETSERITPCVTEGRILTTPASYAYLKIADGCNNRCSYCAIPAIRGKYRSEPMEKLVKESEELFSQGVRELVLVAQDTTNYGRDLYGKPRLCELIRNLLPVGFWKIRILYAYPERIDDELIDLLATEKRVCRYIDMPLQHIDGDILRKMRRPSKEESIRELIVKLRERVPDIVIRSTFITAFPTETEEQHRKLLSFIREGNIDFGGFFIYSPEEGTEAEKLKPRLLKRIAAKRKKELEEAQGAAMVEAQKRYVGQTLEVLYEGIDYGKQMFKGRSEFHAPDVDTAVYFTADFPVEAGKVYNVKITSSENDLYGEAMQGGF